MRVLVSAMIMIMVQCTSSSNSRISTQHIFASAIQEKSTQPRRSLHFGGIIPDEQDSEPSPPPAPSLAPVEEGISDSGSDDTAPMPTVPPPVPSAPPEPPPTMLSANGMELLALEFPRPMRRPGQEVWYLFGRENEITSISTWYDDAYMSGVLGDNKYEMWMVRILFFLTYVCICLWNPSCLLRDIDVYIYIHKYIYIYIYIFAVHIYMRNIIYS